MRRGTGRGSQWIGGRERGKKGIRVIDHEGTEVEVRREEDHPTITLVNGRLLGIMRRGRLMVEIEKGIEELDLLFGTTEDETRGTTEGLLLADGPLPLLRLLPPETMPPLVRLNSTTLLPIINPGHQQRRSTIDQLLRTALQRETETSWTQIERPGWQQ